MKKAFYFLFFFCMEFILSAQIPCDKTKLYGKWKYVAVKSNTRTLDLPTLRNKAAEGKVYGVYHFRENGTWTYKSSTYLQSEKDALKTRHFFINETICELKLHKRYLYQRDKPMILYFTNDTLVITSSNPHWDSINLWVKEK